MSSRYQRPKFGRERDQRRALMKSLADSLILQESISTTVPKAKAVISYTEKLITRAKKNDLASRRQLISSLATKTAAHKLMNELAPKLANRNSGYLRMQRTGVRRGDGTQLAKISFVDDLKDSPKDKDKVAKKPNSSTTSAKKKTENNQSTPNKEKK